MLSKQVGSTDTKASATNEPQIFNRYYHMFAEGELRGLVEEATRDLGLHVGSLVSNEDFSMARGIEIVRDGWERSNYYVELRCWENRH